MFDPQPSLCGAAMKKAHPMIWKLGLGACLCVSLLAAWSAAPTVGAEAQPSPASVEDDLERAAQQSDPEALIRAIYSHYISRPTTDSDLNNVGRSSIYRANLASLYDMLKAEIAQIHPESASDRRVCDPWNCSERHDMRDVQFETLAIGPGHALVTVTLRDYETLGSDAPAGSKPEIETTKYTMTKVDAGWRIDEVQGRRFSNNAAPMLYSDYLKEALGKEEASRDLIAAQTSPPQDAPEAGDAKGGPPAEVSSCTSKTQFLAEQTIGVEKDQMRRIVSNMSSANLTVRDRLMERINAWHGTFENVRQTAYDAENNIRYCEADFVSNTAAVISPEFAFTMVAGGINTSE